MCLLKNDTNELIYKPETHSDIEDELTVMEWGRGIYTLLYLKWLTNKDLLCSTGNSARYSVVVYLGKESEKE